MVSMPITVDSVNMPISTFINLMSMGEAKNIVHLLAKIILLLLLKTTFWLLQQPSSGIKTKKYNSEKVHNKYPYENLGA
jgi:hypothetical protein